MYKELLSANLESARKAEKRSSLLYFLLSLLLCALLVFGAVGYLGGTLEVPSWLPYKEDSMGIGCAGFSLLLLGAAVFFLVQLMKNISSSATGKRMGKILENARAIGPEDEVFGKLDQMEPRTVGDWLLRYDEEICSGTSPKDPDANFLYPMSRVVRAGVIATGKGRKMKYNLFIHGTQDGKTVKCSRAGDYSVIVDILKELEKLNPKMSIGLNA